ncbi:hypothetical protein RQP53_02600 [Paucibacter sp. APW11]|uniref:Type 4 fimbrial biogenesis protein PilX N-terminal domain-containing protein n=1 Tax=Roseateles aquae TaxID=3077235 RepID=A0ABU3P7G4_9BURK|nr:hypothetical protein [Paucibacter sp. APW11]MDT8998160.1 hypothetical protein [Paucibacter sp. APW11]
MKTRRSQAGMASLLFMLLSGLALGAMVFGAVYYVRGLQAQSVTVHALTQAQLRAWSGAEALRQYLYQLGATPAAALSGGQSISFNGLSGVSATVSAVTPNETSNCGGGTLVAADIVGSSGGANSLLGVVYCARGSAASSGTLVEAINIKGDLQLGGDLNVSSDSSTRMVVDGRVSGSGSLNGISNLYASGDVSLGGATSIATLFSEGNISLDGSGQYTSVNSMRNVSLSGSVQVATLNANGAVSLQSNTVTELNAIGNVSLGSNAGVSQLKTQGNVSANNSRITGTASVQGDYSESSNGAVNAGRYGGSLSKPSWNNQLNLSRQAGLQVAITPLTATTISTPRIDTYAFKASANYVFERVGNDTRVTVNSVHSIPDGSYYLAGSGANQDWLCRTNSYAAASCLAKICTGFSDHNSCFSYANGTWTVAGQGMAPGVVWFAGDLIAGQGSYTNTFLASGNISTAGNNISTALNYAGAATVCSQTQFPGLYPSNFCNSSGALIENALGNIVFAAGGYVGSSFSGGRIDLSASNHVYGDVLAGDTLTTGGSTVVHGYMVAARGSNIGSSRLSASTSLDLRNLPSSFKPGQLPTPGTPLSATLLWSRYR